MGSVFEGNNDSLGRRVAIKVLKPGYSREQAMVRRFFNEARVVNLVQHPGIVVIHDMGQLDDGTVFIVMEYLDGQTLTERMRRGCSLREALRIVRQVASALSAAHKKGVIHRDLKPDNLMIVKDPDIPGGERVKVLDFGLAKVAEGHAHAGMDHTRSGMVMGTPKYMSPEQCRGVRGITDRADVYALGVVLYQLLSGKLPFEAEAMGDLLVMQIQKEPPKLAHLCPALPAEVVELVHEMLEKSPDRRPDMAQVARRLERMEEGRGPARESDVGLEATPSMFMALEETPEAVPSQGDSAVRATTSVSLGPLPSTAPPADERDDSESRELERLLNPGRHLRLLLLILGFVGLSALGFIEWQRGIARSWVLGYLHREETPNKDHAQELMQEIDQALAAKQWGLARQRADQLLAQPGLSETRLQVARKSLERAQRELLSEAAVQRFTGALEKGDLDGAMDAYKSLPPGSSYQEQVLPAYRKAFVEFAASHMEKARIAQKNGKCPEAQQHLDLILKMEPKHGPAQRARVRALSCAKGRAEDEEEVSEEEPFVPLPQPPPPPTVLAPISPPAQQTAPKPPAETPLRRPDFEAPPAAPPIDPLVRLKEAMGAQVAGRYAEAIELCRPVTKMQSHSQAAWRILGTAACKSQNLKVVEEAYRALSLEGSRDLLRTCEQAGVVIRGGFFVRIR